MSSTNAVQIDCEAYKQLQQLWKDTKHVELGAVGTLRDRELVHIHKLNYTSTAEEFPFYRYFPCTIHSHVHKPGFHTLPSVADVLYTLSWDGPHAPTILSTECDFVVSHDGIYSFFADPQLIAFFTHACPNRAVFWNVVKSYIGHLFVMKVKQFISFHVWQQQLRILHLNNMHERLQRNTEFVELVAAGTNHDQFPKWIDAWNEWQAVNVNKVDHINGFHMYYNPWPKKDNCKTLDRAS